ncbi:hypothetical protein SCE1572_25525 [Sorangium cellulosum So0157-2]|uniref:Uncharacterized protein n=1 Tax=Sorangium cellulosum So0157-2 TaxID=1254432 RepID=S4XWH9_SORCE|nr:hypothetical protein SCE1572_25525 [Sorangium cellulosum So0157-2]
MHDPSHAGGGDERREAPAVRGVSAEIDRIARGS